MASLIIAGCIFAMLEEPIKLSVLAKSDALVIMDAGRAAIFSNCP